MEQGIDVLIMEVLCLITDGNRCLRQQKRVRPRARVVVEGKGIMVPA